MAPARCWGFGTWKAISQSTEQPLPSLAAMDPSSPGPNSLFWRGRGATVLFIGRLSVALASCVEKVRAATGVLTIARCCWPRQAREAACSVPSCSSLPLPAVSDGGIEMGTALQPWVNAEEGLRAWLPASWLKSRHMCFFWWAETNRFRQSFFREFSQAQDEILRWKKFTHFFPLYWASVVRTNCIFGCLGSMCVTVEHVAVEEHVQYVHVSCTEMWWGGILALDPDWSCSWERKHQDKTGEESTSSVPLTLFWLMLKRYVGYFQCVCVCVC